MSAVDDNDSGVSEDINLNDIDTESKFNKISKQADKAERDLERAEKARIKTEAEVQKSAELLKNLDEKITKVYSGNWKSKTAQKGAAVQTGPRRGRYYMGNPDTLEPAPSG